MTGRSPTTNGDPAIGSRFVCRFAAGANGVGRSSTWRVWTAKNKPDLYIAVRTTAGEMKASVHAPWPPHDGWMRKYGYNQDAKSIVAQHAKLDGGPHKVFWTGCPIGEWTLEYRVIIRGTSLDDGAPVASDVTLLPAPAKDEFLAVAVFLGPRGKLGTLPRERDGESFVLGQGRLCDDRAVFIAYCLRPMNWIPNLNQQLPTPRSSFVNPKVRLENLRNARLRAVVVGDQKDGSLQFMDMKIRISANDAAAPICDS